MTTLTAAPYAARALADVPGTCVVPGTWPNPSSDNGDTMPQREPFQLINTTRDTVIASCTRLADNPWTSFKGLMGAAPLPPGEALLITPSSSIHTHFMRFAIDVLYVSKDDAIVGIDRDLKPWRFGRFYKNVKYVVEMTAGGASGCEVGDKIERR